MLILEEKWKSVLLSHGLSPISNLLSGSCLMSDLLQRAKYVSEGTKPAEVAEQSQAKVAGRGMEKQKENQDVHEPQTGFCHPGLALLSRTMKGSCPVIVRGA